MIEVPFCLPVSPSCLSTIFFNITISLYNSSPFQTTLGALSQAVRTGVRASAPQMTVQEIVAGQATTTRVATQGTSSTAQVLTATTLTPAQLVAAQQRGTVTVAGESAS